jgi:hypothetical protein
MTRETVSAVLRLPEWDAARVADNTQAPPGLPVLFLGRTVGRAAALLSRDPEARTLAYAVELDTPVSPVLRGPGGEVAGSVDWCRPGDADDGAEDPVGPLMPSGVRL